MDEFPEFRRDVINALRQPLEDGEVHVSRMSASAAFPANFMLVAALNPCPCGKWGTAKCTCQPAATERYRRKISGPIADRIDMWIEVGEIPPEELGARSSAHNDETGAARGRIADARDRQRQRFVDLEGTYTNSDLSARTIEHHALLAQDAQNALVSAAHTLSLSPRGYHRTIKLARTIADVAASETIEQAHMLEALQYRPKGEWS